MTATSNDTADRSICYLTQRPTAEACPLHEGGCVGEMCDEYFVAYTDLEGRQHGNTLQAQTKD